MADRILTVKQPWADLIMAGVKDVENRSWRVPETLWGEGGEFTTSKGSGVWLAHPFRLGIHAAKKPAGMVTTGHVWRSLDEDQAGTLDAMPGEPWERLGVLLGYVTVTGCHHAEACRYVDPTEGGDDPLTVDWCSPWAQHDVYHWALADPVPLDVPVPMKGRLGLWRPEEVSA